MKEQILKVQAIEKELKEMYQYINSLMTKDVVEKYRPKGGTFDEYLEYDGFSIFTPHLKDFNDLDEDYFELELQINYSDYFGGECRLETVDVKLIDFIKENENEK